MVRPMLGGYAHRDQSYTVCLCGAYWKIHRHGSKQSDWPSKLRISDCAPCSVNARVAGLRAGGETWLHGHAGCWYGHDPTTVDEQRCFQSNASAPPSVLEIPVLQKKRFVSHPENFAQPYRCFIFRNRFRINAMHSLLLKTEGKHRTSGFKRVSFLLPFTA
ncbi:hypothetical protein SAMN04515617_12061 [Collimonas sp. OK242]|nr:hypothetical protein SAMN04515617_12061 [Collimonas sp. OK242]